MDNMKTWAVPYAYLNSDDNWVGPQVAVVRGKTPFKALKKVRLLIQKSEVGQYQDPDHKSWIWLSAECLDRLHEFGIIPRPGDFDSADEEGWAMGYPQNIEVINEHYVSV